MSLPPKNSTQNAIAAAVCAAIVVVACVPIAAFFATFGDSYNQRALIYCVILLWGGGAGAVAIFSLTWRNMSKKVTAGLMIKWIVSAFLWPLLLLSWLVVGRKRRKDEQTK